MKNFITLVFVILNAVCIDLNAQFSLFGIVKDQVTNEPLIGVNLKVNNSKDLEKKALNLFKNKRNIYNKIKKLKKIGDLILKKNLTELERILK